LTRPDDIFLPQGKKIEKNEILGENFPDLELVDPTWYKIF